MGGNVSDGFGPLSRKDHLFIKLIRDGAEKMREMKMTEDRIQAMIDRSHAVMSGTYCPPDRTTAIDDMIGFVATLGKIAQDPTSENYELCLGIEALVIRVYYNALDFSERIWEGYGEALQRVRKAYES